MLDVSLIINLVPEPWRTYLLAAVFAFLATQMVASLIVAILPAAAFVHPLFGRYARGLAAYAHFTPKDASGTLKIPLRSLDARSLEELARVAEQAKRVVDFTRTPPSNGQSGAVRVGALLAICGAVVVASVVGAVLTGCPRLPPVSGCAPRAYRCTDSGRPEVCSTSQRWEPIGDEPCSASGNVCVVDRTAHCAPMTVTADGGTP